MGKKRIFIAVGLGLAALTLLAAVPLAGMTHFSGIGIIQPTFVGTATPALSVNNQGVSKAVEVLDSGTPVFEIDDAGVIDANSNAVLNIGASGTDFSATGGLTLAAGLTVSDGDVVVADDLRVTAQTSITVTDTAAFTPTGTYQGITAAGEVTPTITAGATAGDVLVLINTSDQTINIADSGTTMLTAAAALGQYDVLVLWSDGTNWIEISRANN
jgi:hypothetical protein